MRVMAGTSFNIIHPLFIRDKGGISLGCIRGKSERRKMSDSDSNAHRSRYGSRASISWSIVFIGRTAAAYNGWKLFMQLYLLTHTSILHTHVYVETEECFLFRTRVKLVNLEYMYRYIHICTCKVTIEWVHINVYFLSSFFSFVVFLQFDQNRSWK